MTLLRRDCLSCGEAETGEDNKSVYFIQDHSKRLPPGRCRRCGSGNLLVADSFTLNVRYEPKIVWPHRRIGRPPVAGWPDPD